MKAGVGGRVVARALDSRCFMLKAGDKARRLHILEVKGWWRLDVTEVS